MNMELGRKPQEVAISMKGFKAEQGDAKPTEPEITGEAVLDEAASAKFVAVESMRTNRKTEKLALGKKKNIKEAANAMVQELDKENAQALVEKNIELTKNALEQFKGQKVFVTLEDGRKVEAKTLNGENDKNPNVVLTYRDGGMLHVVEQAPGDFMRTQKGTLEREVAGADARETGEALLAESMDALKEASPKIFDAVTKSKWGLASRAGKLFTSMVGMAGKTAEATGAADFYRDMKTVALGTEKVGQEDEEAMGGVVAGEVGIAGAAKRGMEMLWGVPKDLLKALKAEEAEDEALAKAEFELGVEDLQEKMKNEPVTAQELKGAPLAMVKGVLETIKTEMVRPVLKGNLEMVAYIQDKLAGKGEEYVDLGEEYQDLQELDAEVEFYGMEFEETANAEAENLQQALDGLRIEKLASMLAATEKEKERLMGQTAGMSLTERRDRLKTLSEIITSQREELHAATSKKEIAQLQKLENIQENIDTVVQLKDEQIKLNAILDSIVIPA